jgi:hypothetical protein
MRNSLWLLYGPFIALTAAIALGPKWLTNGLLVAGGVCCAVWMCVGIVIVLIVGIKDYRDGRITALDLATGVVFGWIGAPMLMRTLLRKD